MASSRSLNVLMRRATQCSFSSAFHLAEAGASTRQTKTINSSFSAMVAAPIILAGVWTLYKTDGLADLRLPSTV